MKTIKEQIEEKAREYLDQIKKDYPQEIVDKNSVITDFREGANLGISLAQRWIDVSEPPKVKAGEYKLCLVRESNGHTWVAHYIAIQKDFWIIERYSKTVSDFVHRSNHDITHWRPIDITIE